MSNYKRGTQADLDAAKDDATLLPFDTVFISHDRKFIRYASSTFDSPSSVIFVQIPYLDLWECFNAASLLPAKKQKKAKRIPWQNGIQEDLDNAKEDARLIPKKTYFMSKYGVTEGMLVYRIDNYMNDVSSILMFSDTLCDADFHTAEDLEPIKEE